MDKDKEITKADAHPITAPMQAPVFNLTPATLAEAMEMAKLMADSDMVPKDYKGKPGNVLIAVQMGAELGLKPVQSVQTIAVINGRPSVWGDGFWALIKSSPLCEWTHENYDVATDTATVLVKRRGDPEPHEGVFSKADAVKAGLMGKDTYKSYLRDMLTWRARSRAGRSAIPEAIKGIYMAEEARDMPPVDMGNVEVVRPQIQMPRAKQIEQAIGDQTRTVTVDHETGEVKSEPVQEQREPAKRDSSAPKAGDSQKNLIRAKLEQGAIGESEMFRAIGIDAWDAMSVEDGNEALKFLKSPQEYQRA